MKPHLKHLLPLSILLTALGISLAQDAPEKEEPAPLKVLLVAGGCCHDYATQTKLLKAGIEERLNAEVTVEFNPSKAGDATFPIYDSPDWADAYDVILHDECTAKITDIDYVKRIIAPHRDGKPAVNIHCAMHSYRWGNFREPVKIGDDNAGWYEMVGIQSSGHGPQSPIDVIYTDKSHPAVKGLEDWTTINEELYNNIQIFEGTQTLADGKQTQAPRKKDLKKNPDAKPKEAKAVVVWANEFGPKKTKIFSTSLGHNNETVADDRYLDLVTRGLLWTTGNLAEDGSAKAGLAR